MYVVVGLILITVIIGFVKTVLYFYPAVVTRYRICPFVLYVQVIPVQREEVRALKEKGFVVLC